MSALLALDIAILPPPDVTRRAIELSSALPPDETLGLTLDDEHLPHVTLTQHFVRVDELDGIFERVNEIMRDQPPLTLHVSGGGRGGAAVWMAIERSDALVQLHERLLETLRGFERPGGTPAAFYEGDARVGDVIWVTGYRLKSSLHAYTPHITLGHAKEPPAIAPFTFDGTAVAACHLGRFCSCRKVLRQWELT